MTVFSLLVAAMVALSVLAKNQRSEIRRLESNQSALLDSVKIYRTKEGLSAASVQVLELTKAELEEDCKSLADQVRSLGIKLKRAESIAQSATQTVLELQLEARDSVIYVRDSVSSAVYPDSLKYFEWSDPWVRFKGELRGEVLDTSIESSDTLTTVLHRVPRKCLLFRWSKNEYRAEIISSNPHTNITYEQYIRVSNK